MDEVIRIYNPLERKNSIKWDMVETDDELDPETGLFHHGIMGMKWGARRMPKPESSESAVPAVKAKENSKKRKHWFYLDDYEIWEKVIEEDNKRTDLLAEKHPWIPIIVNWIMAGLTVALIIAFIGWGIGVHTDNRATAYAATALADYQAEQQSLEEARQAELRAAAASEEAVIKAEAEIGAKLLYPLQNFVSKYGYSRQDLKTYVRCAIDRVEYGGGVNDLHAIAAQESQFLGYSDNNPVLADLYQIAYDEISTWHHETTKPWDSSFRFAELKSDGIWLTNEFNADGYARRVRYD